MSVIIQSIIVAYFYCHLHWNRPNSGQRRDQANKFILLYAWCNNHCLNGLQSSFIIWTLLRSSFTGCNPEFAILSSLKLLHCISCSFDDDLFLSRVQYQFLQVDRILLVQGFGNRASTKTIAGTPFGGRGVKWWFSVLNLSDPWYINAKLSNRMCDKTSLVIEKIRFLIST